ncbi:MAG: hypothetical protein H6662_14315 [Ardenticatenaceae bacterium]|nr:hypothetical protein [Anaerolineales bacterium]MCB8922758.1 hypothetical protein [Ardenticatenaceae bacterium]
MTEQRYCDFCGRPEDELKRIPNSSAKLELGADGLWVCGDCRTRLQSTPVGQLDEFLDEAVKALIGQSVGAICYTLNLPYEPPYQAIIDAASLIGYDEDLYMSAWLFVTQWLDGTTVWRAEDGRGTAVVTPDGAVHIETG